MRTVAVATVARSDYGLYRPILRRMREHPALRARLVVAATHLDPEFGTVRDIEADGFPIAARVEMTVASDRPEGAAESMGLGLTRFAEAFVSLRPDLVLVLGDRFEMFAAAVAALPLRIPVAHIHGGELTQGVIDDALRHATTKLSHLHFVATEAYGRRVRQMGEEAWRVMLTGSPAVDNLLATRPMPREELSARYGVTADPAPLLVTYHPVTLEYESTDRQVEALLAALQIVERPVVFTAPNADPGGRHIRQRLAAFAAAHPWSRLVEHFGSEGYAGMMAMAAAMVGNSSSGLIEAASFGLPVVNIGRRQDGRIRARNVIDVVDDRNSIVAGIRTALSAEFRAGLAGLRNPYGDGRAAERIVEALAQADLHRLIPKRFADLPVPGDGT